MSVVELDPDQRSQQTAEFDSGFHEGRQ